MAHLGSVIRFDLISVGAESVGAARDCGLEVVLVAGFLEPALDGRHGTTRGTDHGLDDLLCPVDAVPDGF